MEEPSKIEAAHDGTHNRDAARDSLLLVAALKRATGVEQQVRVRNLSAGGMMADSAVAFAPDERVEITLRGIGAIGGRVAWSDGERVGVAFDGEIDPKRARKPVAKAVEAPISARGPLFAKS